MAERKVLGSWETGSSVGLPVLFALFAARSSAYSQNLGRDVAEKDLDTNTKWNIISFAFENKFVVPQLGG